MNNNLPTVTVLMPILNEATFIQKSLGAVLAQDYPTECMEVLVVDGGSTDGTQKIVQEIKKCHPNVKLLNNPQRIQATALNIGILAAQGDIIVRVDGHTIIAPDYVRNCANYLVDGRADNVGGLMRPIGTTYVGEGVALATTSPFGIGGSKFHYSEQEQYVDTVYLGAYWRKTFDQIGLYDEAVHINEDYELNYRLRKAGGKILLSPAIKSTYTPRSSLIALCRQYFQYGRWKVKTLQKHPSSLQWRQVVAPLFVVAILISFVLQLLFKPFRWLFAVASGAYLLANFLASTIAARKGGWKYLPVLPVVFATIHFAWGLGFWQGVVLVLLPHRRK